MKKMIGQLCLGSISHGKLTHTFMRASNDHHDLTVPQDVWTFLLKLPVFVYLSFYHVFSSVEAKQ